MKRTAIFGTAALDEARNLLRYQLQIAGEAPELEQTLAELFAQLPE